MVLPVRHALRDGVLVAGTLALWSLDASLRDAGGPVATGVAWLTGAATALVGYLVHEWGHWLAATLSGATVHLPGSARSAFLFRFDPERSSRAQFLAMSLGGYAATAGVVAALVVTLPLPALSARVALGLTALGVLATALLELPPFLRVLRGGPLPRGAAYQSASPGEPLA
jgi:hypothetical protein